MVFHNGQNGLKRRKKLVSEAMRQVKKQHFEVKFWNWGPETIWNILKCVPNLFQKSLRPIIALQEYLEEICPNTLLFYPLVPGH